MKRFLAIGECMVEFAPDGPTGLFRRGFAGDSFNTVWHFARLAPSSWHAAYCTAIGDDALSGAMVAFMQAADIDMRDVRRIKGRECGLYVISLANGERSFSYWRSQSAARHLADDPSLLEAAIAAADEILFTGITLAILPPASRRVLLDLLGAARAAGKGVSFDPNIRPRLWEDSESMRHAIVDAARVSNRVLPSFDDEAAHFGDVDPEATCRRYAALGANEIIVKCGAKGVCFIDNGRVVEVAPAKALTPVDTTGAGDGFNAGFLAARFDGCSIIDACRFANRVSGEIILGPGALVPVGARLQTFAKR
jgi:2-dehydro-3-deoxygluconokinase